MQEMEGPAARRGARCSGGGCRGARLPPALLMNAPLYPLLCCRAVNLIHHPV